jgi:hypothetical protein
MKTKTKKTRVRTPALKGYGRLFDSDKLLEQEVEFISEGVDETGKDYDFFLGKISRSPIVKSRTTGRCYILPWPDIIKLGANAGLNMPAKGR